MSSAAAPSASVAVPRRIRTDGLFYALMGTIGGIYVVMLIGLLVADVAYMVTSEPERLDLPEWVRPHTTVLRPVLPMIAALADRNIQHSIQLTLISCGVTAALSLIVAVPIGYLLSRFRFFGRNLIDAILDIPIVLPPLVVGLSLLILFQFPPFLWMRSLVVYQVPAVILAQFMVAAAFAVRTMRATFDQIDTRREEVALTLGCSRAQAFFRVALPEAETGILTAGTLAWARALGEFGPLLVFAGTTRRKTEVLSSTVFLELSVGNLSGAVAVSLIMVACAVLVLIVARVWGTRSLTL
ncbi:MAG: ABC transporter permease [Planctomycetales bacterium]